MLRICAIPDCESRRKYNEPLCWWHALKRRSGELHCDLADWQETIPHETPEPSLHADLHRQATRATIGERRVGKEGYAYIKTRRGWVTEHKLVMEERLNRPLDVSESVHHINGVRDDNRPENLELWMQPQPRGVRVSDTVMWAINVLQRYAQSF